VESVRISGPLARDWRAVLRAYYLSAGEYVQHLAASSFGFEENPYDNQGLPGDETGDHLLVGREAEIAEVQRKIASAGTHPSVEGLAGVGKTSMLAVAGYRMMQTTVVAAGGTLFVPAREFFQASESLADFEDDVFRQVAQTLIETVEAFRRAAIEVPDIEGLNKWLNSPQYRSAGISSAIVGGNYGSEPNTSEGFARSGFPEKVKAELERCFPKPGAGAVICVLDNLELLQTSAAARETLEGLRDRVFNVTGLRWVLCGSRGIVSRARSQRLSGVFDPPMQVGPLPDDDSMELIRRRLEHFGDSGSYAPVPPEAFEFLYRALHSNLRDAMAHAQQFSDWLYGEYIAPGRELPPLDDRQPLLEAWLTEQAETAEGAARVQPRVWQFFDDLARDGGRCRASEAETYGFNTQQQMGSAVTALANANLLIRETDPENATKNIHTITPQGWLVFFHRNGYETPTR
jgi:hypothetical protein